MMHSPDSRRFLLPLTPLYRAALALRELRLRSGLEPVRRLQRPVISIGSLSAGGSGKTPLTIALAHALTQLGIYVDVLSRGYGRTSKGVLRVDPDGDAAEFGDEPLLIARESGVPVYVAAKRYDAGLLAESAQEDPAASAVHILDDGFQHRQLHRDVNILLLDSRDLHEHLLPAGNLREPPGAMHRAHVIAIPADQSGIDTKLRTMQWNGPVWRLKRRMEVPSVAGPVVAFCGIARSDQFFAGLEASGLHLASRIAFADHHRYDQHDLDCILGASRNINASAFITTEKDRARLGKLAASFSESCPLNTARLSIEIEDQDAAVNWILGRLPISQERSNR
jgi:tetraacyldisaccharide 4'-kinase